MEASLSDLTKTIRGFTGTKLPDPQNHTKEIFISRILPAVEEFISLERDESRNLDAFLERLAKFIGAIPDISFDGGSKEERDLLEKECKMPPGEHILALTVVELKTMVDDFKLQIEGASREVNTDGFSDKEPPGRPKGDAYKDRGDGKKIPPGSVPPPSKDESDSTWRGSLERRKDDDFEESSSGDWRESLGDLNIDSGIGDDWKSSLGEDFDLDRFISEEASTDYDRQVAGDSYGYRRGLHEKHMLAKRYLEDLKVMSEYFDNVIKPNLGF